MTTYNANRDKQDRTEYVSTYNANRDKEDRAEYMSTYNSNTDKEDRTEYVSTYDAGRNIIKQLKGKLKRLHMMLHVMLSAREIVPKLKRTKQRKIGKRNVQQARIKDRRFLVRGDLQ